MATTGIRSALPGAFLVASLLGCGGGGGSTGTSQPPANVVGHLSFLLTDASRANRLVAVSVWYPASGAAVGVSTPLAQYPLDAFTGKLPSSPSADWEAVGSDRAYEGIPRASPGSFPLLALSAGAGLQSWCYVSIGARLAGHGYVVAAVEHHGDGQWSFSPRDGMVTAMLHRPADLAFAVTSLLLRSATPGDALYGATDASRVAVGGHSLGGYAAYTLAAGDDLVCDALYPANHGEPVPYPADTCVASPPDGRVKAVVSLDGSSQLLRWGELARVKVPNLILGETVEASAAILPELETWMARPHAAIARGDSYRVDVEGASHWSFSNWCDGLTVLRKYVLSDADYADLRLLYACDTSLAPALALQVVERYLVAFLDTHLRGLPDGQGVLTPAYATAHTPPVRFFDVETCQATLPDDTYFTYRPHQAGAACVVAQKNPTDDFAP